MICYYYIFIICHYIQMSNCLCASPVFQVDVMALMTWWGLTIDTVSCIMLVLCIGLCVDYSAHVALHFMQVGNNY